MPVKVKESREVISRDLKNNTSNTKYTFCIELADICKDDIIVLEKNAFKQLGGIGPLLLCYKISSQIHFIDPFTFDTTGIDSNTYWKYNLKSTVDRSCVREFLVSINYNTINKDNKC